VSTDDPDAGGSDLPGTTGTADTPIAPRRGPKHASTRRSRRRARARARKHPWLRRVLLTLSLVLVVLVASIGGYAYYLNGRVHRITVLHFKPAPKKGADVGTENILMVGSTSRCALTVQNPAYGLCSEGVTGVNSDVIMVLHLNPSMRTVSVLSIPRDLFIPNARETGANKIDAALYEGPSQLVAAIQEDFGIPIQHYVELNFDTFADVVNALGGVSMYFPEPVFDAYSGLDVTSTGCIHLNGVEALQVVRARHLQYRAPGITTSDPYYWPQEGESDLARIRRDHEFLRVLASAVAAQGLGNPITDLEIVSSVAPDLTVDSTLSTPNMANLVITYHGINPFDAPELTVPVMESDINQYDYEGGAYGNVEFPTEPQDFDVIDQFLGVGATSNTLTGEPLPSPGSVSVAIENGSGYYSAGQTAETGLQALGFDVTGVSTTEKVGEQAETVVEYSQDTPTEEAAAQAVARSISGQVIMALASSSSGSQTTSTTAPASSAPEVTVITGTDFAVNPPTPPPTTTTTTTVPKGTTTTTTSVPPTTTTTVPGFAPPTASVQPLAAWDPRSCTATGGEGP